MLKNKPIIRYFFLSLIILFLFTVSGCVSAARHQRSLGSAQEREMTLGIVQKEIRVGMSQADVATSLGSPNIVTKDSSGKETWIYDKIASEVSYSVSGGYANLVIVGGAMSAGAASSTQKTLTVVIKFNEKNLVESFSYHSSKF